MLKNLLLKKLIPLIIYSVVYLYYMIFNWKVFTLSLNVNLGFGVVRMPPSIILFLLGFILIGVLSWITYITSLRKIILELEHGVEMGKTKDRMLRGKLKEHLENEINLDLLREKLGIPEIQKEHKEFRKQLDDLTRENLSRKDH
ncbi:MAG: hypothetical protein P1P86_11715 [Bacteroidales bacterium]|nr:hypothetical protein [Bacteroidales bacterium]